MAGPIARAFVDIVARLRVEMVENDIDDALRAQIKAIEGQLESLEGAAGAAGRRIEQQLRQAKIALDVRPAIVDLHRIEETADHVIGTLRQLSTVDSSFRNQKFLGQVDRMERAVVELGRTLVKVSDTEIDFNVGGATTQLKALDRVAEDLTRTIANTKNVHVRIQAEQALSELAELRATVNDTLDSFAKMETRGRVRINVDDTEILKLQQKLDALQEKTTLVVKANVNDTGIDRLGDKVRKLDLNLLSLGDQFRNIAFRAASYLAVGQALSAFQRMISFGLQAAGEIQTVTVGINRLFADMAELGSTASEFMGRLKDVAIKTPFEFVELADTSRRLVQLGGDADLAIERMTALADAGAAVGATSDDINGVVRALSQMAAKGRINLQDLNQVAERLPNFQRTMQLQGVIQELEDMGSPLAKTVDSFEDLRKAGVDIDTVINGIFRGLELIPGAAGAAAAQARTLTGALSNLKDFAQIEFAEAFKEVGATLAGELNDAFATIDDRTGATTSKLADSISEVIGAFGTGLNSALPPLLDFFNEVSSEFAGLADAAAGLAASLASGFGGDFAEGLLDGLNAVINAFTVLNDLLSVLPEGFSQGLGQITTQLIALTRAGVPAFQPFVKLVNDLIFSFKAVQSGASTMGAAIAGLGPALAGAAASAGGLALLTVVMNRMADNSRRTREFAQSVNAATTALEELNSVGEAAVAFLDNFEEAGEGVNLGELESQFDGLTTLEIEEALKLDEQALADLVTAFAKMPNLGLEFGNAIDVDKPSADFIAALDSVGLSMSDLNSLGESELANLERNLIAVSEQFAEAAKVSVLTAQNTKRFGFIDEDIVDQVVAAAEATGDYVTAQEELVRLNNSGAQQSFRGLARQLNLTAHEQREIINNNTDLVTGTTDWVAANGQLQQRLLEINEAMITLKEQFVGFEGTLDNLKASVDIPTGNINDLGNQFVDFALSADKAGLSADQFNTIALDLDDTLGRLLSGDELGKVVAAIVADVDEMKSSLDAVIPSVADLQLEADNFSLEKFISELNKIKDARANVTENIETLTTEFGIFGDKALEALLNSGLDKDMFAIALEQIIAGGKDTVGRTIGAFADETGPKIQEIAEGLVARGFTKERIEEILGVDAFEEGVGELDSAVDGLTPVAAKLSATLEGMQRAIDTAPTPGIARLLQEDFNFAASQGPADTPGINTAAAVAGATTSGEEIGKALTTSVQTNVAAGFETVSATFAANIRDIGTDATDAALGVGKSVGQTIKLGIIGGFINVDDPILAALARAGRQANTRALEVGRSLGVTLADEFGQAVGDGLDSHLAEAIASIGVFGDTARGAMLNAGIEINNGFQVAVADLSDIIDIEAEEVNNVMDSLVAMMVRLALEAGNKASNVFNKSLNLDSSVKQEMQQVAQALSSGALTASAFNSGFRVGFNFGRGVAAGVTVSIGAAVSSVINMISVMFSAANRKAGIKSPSTLFAKIGKNIGLGVADGIVSALPAVEKAAISMIRTADGSALAGSVMPASVLSGSGGTAFRSNPIAANALNQIGNNLPGRAGTPAVATTSVGGTTHNHQWNIVAPTDDPEALALRVATRLERRLEQ